MSSTTDESELKAGHAPAVKVGGMRVTRPRQNSAGDAKDENKMTKEEQEEYGTSPPKVDKQVLVSGMLLKEEKAYPPEAIKHYHNTPLPSKELRPVVKNHTINQPK